MQTLDKKKNSKSMYFKVFVFGNHLSDLIVIKIFIFYLVPKPNLESFVFIKVLENVEQVTLDPE